MMMYETIGIDEMVDDFIFISLSLYRNMIRLHSAVDLASSLSDNKNLVYLDLSCNSLGREGGEILGAFFTDICTNILQIYLCRYLIHVSIHTLFKYIFKIYIHIQQFSSI